MTPKLIGIHPAIREIRRTLQRLADCGKDILIIGEPGVGKTLVGCLIHSLGPHKDLTLRSLNLALVTERDQRLALLGSELPEASTEREGMIEGATTCLLRNLEHMAPHIQQRLADALTRREFCRTPKGPLHSVRSRFIFTTSAKDFRRLSGSRLIMPIRNLLRWLPKVIIPPLRERLQDIPLIAAHYRKHSLGLSNPALPPDDTILSPQFLSVYPWRDNINELKACLRAALSYSHADILYQKERLEFEKMMMFLDEGDDFKLRESTAIIETRIVQLAIHASGGHQGRAARTLGISTSTVQFRGR